MHTPWFLLISKQFQIIYSAISLFLNICLLAQHSALVYIILQCVHFQCAVNKSQCGRLPLELQPVSIFQPPRHRTLEKVFHSFSAYSGPGYIHPSEWQNYLFAVSNLFVKLHNTWKNWNLSLCITLQSLVRRFLFLSHFKISFSLPNVLLESETHAKDQLLNKAKAVLLPSAC